MAQKTYYVKTNVAANAQKIKIFMGGVELDLSDIGTPPTTRTPNIPLSSNVEWWIIVSKSPVSGYTAQITESSQIADLPIVPGDLDTKITVQTNPGAVPTTGNVYGINKIWGTSEVSPTDNDWTELTFNTSNRTIQKLSGAVPEHIRIALEMNPFGGSTTLLIGSQDYDGTIESSLDSEDWTFSNTISGSESA